MLAAFANVMYIINYKRIAIFEDEILEKYTENNVFNSLINQHLLGLGDFSIEGYSDFDSYQDKILTWGTFFAGTFIIQIVFFNMLIAIMGDTFDKVTDMGRDSIELQEKIQMLSDYIWAVRYT